LPTLWQQCGGRVTAPANAATMRLKLHNFHNNGWVAYDCVIVSGDRTIIKYYFLGGRQIALRRNGQLFYLHGDHLGSTSVMSYGQGHGNMNTAVPDSRGRYLPFGGWRATPTQTITDRGYTGHKQNDDIGLIYMNARYYVPYINRFLSPDSIVPRPTDPQSYNRYSYARNNPLNRIDPTGHVDCSLLDGGADTQACNEAKFIRKTQAGALSTPCLNCPWSDQFGHMGKAYEVFTKLEQELGRPVTYTEVLALVAHHEFGWALQHNQEEYDVALEAMGRQFYNFCGTDGICRGDQLWKFLGAQQAWYAGSAQAFAQELTSGSLPAINFAGAARVLGQPAYNPATATDEQKRSNWRSGNGLGNVPFVYGNYSMYEQYGVSRETLRNRGIDGINGAALTTSYLNKPHVNGWNGNGYLVVTMGQHHCIKGTGPCQ
jgi:RHS repeat-associated protein